MINDSSQAYQNLIAALKRIALMESISAVLGWDERTQMPPAGAELRASQSSMLARLIHDQLTSPQIGQWLADVESSAAVRDSAADPFSEIAVNARHTRRRYDRAIKLPGDLVEEMARVEVMSMQAWAEARRTSDYALFQPWLEQMLSLKRREADCVRRADQSPYEALLDAFEPGETVSTLRRVFGELRGPLVRLAQAISESGRTAPAHILTRHYAIAVQRELSLQAAAAIGFDFNAGRLDVSVHPFSTGIGPGDSRITTRFKEKHFGDAFFSTLHETGHALYNQGLPAAHFGTPRGSYVSLGIHESQSRLWENLVGRSKPFWQFFLPKVKSAFAPLLEDVSLEQWHFAVNDVHRSFIRTESDEVTYNLHVMVRFEIEQDLLSGALAAADLPAAWNQKMLDYLGIAPPNDAQGCLQDVHWSGGAIGYFPTYTLGNLYAAQFFQTARRDIGDLDIRLQTGDFSPLLHWLRTNIHAHGMTYTASQLVARITGQPLSAVPLLKHLTEKSAELYGI